MLQDWALSETTLRTYITDDGFTICGNLEEDWARQACIWELSKKVTNFFEKDHYVRTFGLLQKELENKSNELKLAIRSVSIVLGRQFVQSKTNDAVIDACRNLPSHLHPSCIHGVTEGLLFAGKPKDEFTRALTFCSDPKLKESEQHMCFDTVTEFTKRTQEEHILDVVCAQTPKTRRKEEICGKN